MDLGDGPRFELAEDHHHHLVCESCGDVSEFEECPLDLRLLRDVDFEISSHSLEIYGRCTDCGQRELRGRHVESLDHGHVARR